MKSLNLFRCIEDFQQYYVRIIFDNYCKFELELKSNLRHLYEIRLVALETIYRIFYSINKISEEITIGFSYRPTVYYSGLPGVTTI